MSLQSFRTICCSITACMLLVATTSADDSTQKDKPQAKAAEQWIGQLSSKVDLTSDQKDKIREQLNANSEKVASTWNKFAEANAKAISLEATMYAAIEDSMNDQQKQQFRESRKNRQSQADKSKNAQVKSQADQQKQSGQDDKKADATGNQQANASGEPSSEDKSRSSGKNSTSDKQSNQDDAAYFYVTEMIIVPAQKLASDVQMDTKQRQQCDQACQDFHTKLHQAYSDIQQYHDQLVQLEAEKMLAVEKVLDDEQLQKLKNERSSDQSS